jgi:hypothetical protein
VTRTRARLPAALSADTRQRLSQREWPWRVAHDDEFISVWSRVAQAMFGYEYPDGVELLSTVHFLARHQASPRIRPRSPGRSQHGAHVRNACSLPKTCTRPGSTSSRRSCSQRKREAHSERGRATVSPRHGPHLADAKRDLGYNATRAVSGRRSRKVPLSQISTFAVLRASPRNVRSVGGRRQDDGRDAR